MVTTKTNWQTKKLGEMKKAWIIRWNFHSRDKKEQLIKQGIYKEIVDILSKRKTFDQILNIVKNYYILEMSDFFEKIFLEHYTKGKERKKEFFQRVPVSTFYTTNSYGRYIKSLRENGIDHPKTNKLFYEWNKNPIFIIVGHNPSLEAILVSSLVVYKDENGKETLK